MEAKKISVIIPTYNRKEKLPACVDSVLAQTYQNIEVLVVDDASTDGTEELFREISDPRVKYLRYEENHGACYARNYGAERSDGELIAFQDSDDTWHPDKLEKQVRFLEETQVDMCFCGMNRIATNGNQFPFSGASISQGACGRGVSGGEQSQYTDHADEAGGLGDTAL